MQMMFRGSAAVAASFNKALQLIRKSGAPIVAPLLDIKTNNSDDQLLKIYLLLISSLMLIFGELLIRVQIIPELRKRLNNNAKKL